MLFTGWPLVALLLHFTACRTILVGKRKSGMVVSLHNCSFSGVGSGYTHSRDTSRRSRLPPRTTYTSQGWAGRFPWGISKSYPALWCISTKSNTQRSCSGQEPGILNAEWPKHRARSWELMVRTAKMPDCNMCTVTAKRYKPVAKRKKKERVKKKDGVGDTQTPQLLPTRTKTEPQ